jgi:hypothetical protein
VIGSSIGAGAAISPGKNVLALTATKETKNTKTMRKGSTYCRRIAIEGYRRS